MFEIEFRTKKSSSAYMSISPGSGARGLERLIWLKYCFVLKRQNTFNLELYAVKNTHQIKKIKIVENEISCKKFDGCTCLPPPGVELGTFKDGYVSNTTLLN